MVNSDNPELLMHELDNLAKILLPEIQRFYETEEGQKLFKEWKCNNESMNES